MTKQVRPEELALDDLPLMLLFNNLTRDTPVISRFPMGIALTVPFATYSHRGVALRDR